MADVDFLHLSKSRMEPQPSHHALPTWELDETHYEFYERLSIHRELDYESNGTHRPPKVLI